MGALIRKLSQVSRLQTDDDTSGNWGPGKSDPSGLGYRMFRVHVESHQKMNFLSLQNAINSWQHDTSK